jgi:hypothetical protein
MGVADCAEAAANRAAQVTKPKSFVISCFLLICIQRRAVEMVAIIPMHRQRGRKISPGAFWLCALVDRKLVATASRGFVRPMLEQDACKSEAPARSRGFVNFRRSLSTAILGADKTAPGWTKLLTQKDPAEARLVVMNHTCSQTVDGLKSFRTRRLRSPANAYRSITIGEELKLAGTSVWTRLGTKM